jgi:hypothetical protein
MLIAPTLIVTVWKFSGRCGVNGNKFVLDTNAIINYLNNRIALSEFDNAELLSAHMVADTICVPR